MVPQPHPEYSPNLGLLLDVDGPIASPVTRTVAIPSILHDLVALAAAGVPIAFITGRSDEFIRDSVVAPLLEVGLAEALAVPGARMYGVFEKGGSWATITPSGMGAVEVDSSVALGDDAVSGVRDLVERRFTSTMFFDETKRAMISVEQRTDVGASDYRAAQTDFEDGAFDLLIGLGYGIRYGARESVDATGTLPFRIDSTIISTDIESVLLDKDRGARRALAHFAESGPLPRRWVSMGDSRSDYLMADYLHSEGYDAIHVDVRPSDGMLDRPYSVETVGGLIHDEAGAAYLSERRAELGA